MAQRTSTVIAARDAAFAAMSEGFRLIDLTDTLGPETILWPGAPPLEIVDAVTHDAHGYHARVLTTFEHAGTHFDAPEHFVPGGADTASISIDDLVVPAVVIDISEKAETNPNTIVEPDDVVAFEKEHGTIPAGSAVLMLSGWARRKSSALSYTGSESTTDLKFPGLGVDTLGIDPGDKPDFPVHRTVSHPAGLWHLENLINLEQLPATGGVIVVGVPRIAGGTGFPTRVFAFVPKQ